MEPVSNDGTDLTGTERQVNPLKWRLLSKWLDFTLAVGVWGFVEYMLVWLIPAFNDVYNQFGGNLPDLTTLVIALRKVLGLFVVPGVLAGLVLFQFWRTRRVASFVAKDTKGTWDNRVMLAAVLFGTAVFLFLAIAIRMPLYGIDLDPIG